METCHDSREVSTDKNMEKSITQRNNNGKMEWGRSVICYEGADIRYKTVETCHNTRGYQETKGGETCHNTRGYQETKKKWRDIS